MQEAVRGGASLSGGTRRETSALYDLPWCYIVADAYQLKRTHITLFLQKHSRGGGQVRDTMSSTSFPFFEEEGECNAMSRS
jgi:hypothetical protein